MALSKILPASQEQYVGARNLIINGAMQVSQRGTAFSSVASGGNRYTCDRWGVPRRTKADQSTDAPAGFSFSLLLDREQTGGGEPFTLLQGIEAGDITQTGSYTLSFYAKSPDITTLNINVRDKTTVGEGGTTHSSFVTNQAVTISSSYARYTHTFTISDASLTGTCLEVSIGNTSASQDDTVFITGIQLEVGEVATPFEHESYAATLQKCQRYYWQPEGGANGTGVYGGGANGRATLTFPVILRSAPTLTYLSGGSTTNNSGLDRTVNGLSSSGSLDNHSASIQLTFTATATGGVAFVYKDVSMQISAEL